MSDQDITLIVLLTLALIFIVGSIAHYIYEEMQYQKHNNS